ncbi:hypothetical protein V8V70_21340 [Mesobacillus zeae]|nr:hypothetical protein [Mesobacillus zeae]
MNRIILAGILVIPQRAYYRARLGNAVPYELVVFRINTVVRDEVSAAAFAFANRLICVQKLEQVEPHNIIQRI